MKKYVVFCGVIIFIIKCLFYKYIIWMLIKNKVFYLDEIVMFVIVLEVNVKS